MIMKRNISIILFLLIAGCFGSFAQDYYYYTTKVIVPLRPCSTRVSVVTPKSLRDTVPLKLPSDIIPVDTARYKEFDFYVYEKKQSNDSALLIDVLKGIVDTTKSVLLPVYYNHRNRYAILGHWFNVRVKDSCHISLVKEYAVKHKLKFCGVESINKWNIFCTLMFTPQTKEDPLHLINRLHEKEFVMYAAPHLENSVYMHGSHDPYFHHQWNLFNVNSQRTGSTGIDIKACAAWSYATGRGVKVAVIDTGIDTAHTDLNENIYPVGYDAEDNSNNPVVYHVHGTMCAGVIAAKQNNGYQMVGVAPDATLMNVSFFPENWELTRTFSDKMAKAVDWSWRNGADVISCSWSYGYEPNVEEALDSALVRGRNGKGCVVVFSSGNDPTEGITFPATYRPEIMVVGSVDIAGNLSEKSAYGSHLDVVAPGDSIPLLVPGGSSIVYGTGSSFAAPHVAGLAALILERNPNLTGQQVRDIIERNAAKIGNSTYRNVSNRNNGIWNSEYGYGLIDAHAAVTDPLIWTNY